MIPWGAAEGGIGVLGWRLEAKGRVGSSAALHGAAELRRLPAGASFGLICTPAPAPSNSLSPIWNPCFPINSTSQDKVILKHSSTLFPLYSDTLPALNFIKLYTILKGKSLDGIVL